MSGMMRGHAYEVHGPRWNFKRVKIELSWNFLFQCCRGGVFLIRCCVLILAINHDEWAKKDLRNGYHLIHFFSSFFFSCYPPPSSLPPGTDHEQFEYNNLAVGVLVGVRRLPVGISVALFLVSPLASSDLARMIQKQWSRETRSMG